MTDPLFPTPISLPGPRRRSRRPAALTLLTTIAVITVGCSTPGTAPTDVPQTPSSSVPSSSVPSSSVPSSTAAPNSPPTQLTTAWTQLQTLPVKGRAPKTGYSREQFGQAWSDDVGVDGGHNGCDTRNDILRRDLADVVFKPGTRDCVVASGTLHDPYTGTTVPFVRGSTTSSAVQIDHVVALSDAWQKGAQQWTPQKRADFANDPRNLQATVGAVNQQKGAGDAATWLPPHTPYRCTYAARQIEVKAAYGLWVTAAERDALQRILRGCGAGD